MAGRRAAAAAASATGQHCVLGAAGDITTRPVLCAACVGCGAAATPAATQWADRSAPAAERE
eukprot:gene36506-57142_t